MAKMIVDAQVHTWTSGTPPCVHRQTPYTNDELIADMNAAGVDRAVLVPPGWDPSAIAHAEVGAMAHPERLCVMGNIDIEDERNRVLICNWRKRGKLGFRLTFATPERRALLSDGTADWFWAAAEEADLPVMLAIWGELDLAIPIAARYPGLRLIIDHFGIAVTHRTMDDAAFDDLPAVLALSRFPNVAIKASGLPAHSTSAYPYSHLQGYVRRIFDAYGPRRMFWGTDLTRMPCSYRQCITLFTEEMHWLSEEDKRQIMGLALCDWIGWPPAA